MTRVKSLRPVVFGTCFGMPLAYYRQIPHRATYVATVISPAHRTFASYCVHHGTNRESATTEGTDTRNTTDGASREPTLSKFNGDIGVEQTIDRFLSCSEILRDYFDAVLKTKSNGVSDATVAQLPMDISRDVIEGRKSAVSVGRQLEKALFSQDKEPLALMSFQWRNGTRDAIVVDTLRWNIYVVTEYRTVEYRRYTVRELARHKVTESTVHALKVRFLELVMRGAEEDGRTLQYDAARELVHPPTTFYRIDWF